MQCNPALSLRTADPLSRVRANALTEENMKAYFDLLEKTDRPWSTEQIIITWMKLECHLM